MENKIKKKIDRIENITRYITTVLFIILISLGKITENNVFYAISWTIFICGILEMIILLHLWLSISDIFFEQTLEKFNIKED